MLDAQDWDIYVAKRMRDITIVEEEPKQEDPPYSPPMFTINCEQGEDVWEDANQYTASSWPLDLNTLSTLPKNPRRGFRIVSICQRVHKKKSQSQR